MSNPNPWVLSLIWCVAGIVSGALIGFLLNWKVIYGDMIWFAFFQTAFSLSGLAVGFKRGSKHNLWALIGFLTGPFFVLGMAYLLLSVSP